MKLLTRNTIYIFLFIFTFVSCTGSEVDVEIHNPSSSNSINSLNIFVETASDGSGSKVSTQSLWTRDNDIQFFAIQRDLDGKFLTNKTVLWSLEGTAGTLTVQGGGKSASFSPNTAGAATITYTVDGVSNSLEVNVNYNEAPTLTLSTPGPGLNVVLETENFNLSWVDSDSDDDAQISFYYSSSSSGDCSSNTLIVGSISENDGTDSYAWDTTGVNPGIYYLCASVVDSAGTTDFWNPQALTVTDNTPPSFAFTNPAPSTYYNIVPAATGIDIAWTDSDVEENATIDLYYKTSNVGACNAGTFLASTTEDSAVDLYSWDTSSITSNEYFICARIDDGFNAPVEVYSSRLSVSRNCQWLGITDAYETASNWANCNSSVPRISDYILLVASAFDPVLSSDRIIYGFAPGGTQETFTINSGNRLQIRSDVNFQSSVTLKGDSANCLDCKVELWTNDAYIINGSTLRVEPGITFESSTASLDFGDGTTSGHLEVVGGAGPNEQVRFLSIGSWGFRGFNFNGSPANKSTANISNAIVELYHGYSSGSVKGFHFKDHYEILGMDNITFDEDYDESASTKFTFENCSNGVFTDSDFSNIAFINHIPTSGANVSMDVSTCLSIPVAGAITMTGASGYGFGSPFEVDPNNLVTWFNEAGSDCVWTGANNTDWTDAGNWSGCNSRGEFPDQFDTIVVPDGLLYQPVISENSVIGSVGISETSGGLITINGGNRLWISNQEIHSDVKITGGSDSCSDCLLAYDELSILSDATLTIERGIRIKQSNGKRAFIVGDGLSTGHLVINPNSSDKSHWPSIVPTAYYNNGIIVTGVDAANRSSLFINGLDSTMHTSTNNAIRLEDHYELKNLDNLSIDSAFDWEMAGTRVQINNCANGLFTDSSWDQIDFEDTRNEDYPTAYNVEFTNCNGAAIGPIDIITMSGGVNLGFGAVFANDPENFLIWSP